LWTVLGRSRRAAHHEDTKARRNAKFKMQK
jgi:hypothetical protein